MRTLFIFLVILLLIELFTSCEQIGGKILFTDGEWIKMRENEKEGIDWYTMLDEYNEKWTINGLNLKVNISANHTAFSSKEPYFIVFFLQNAKDSKENYIQFIIKDVKINGTSGNDYQSIANSIFPITQPLEMVNYNPNLFKTASVFPFSFENLLIVFTIEIQTVDNIESKTFEYNLSPSDNPPVPIWQSMGR